MSDGMRSGANCTRAKPRPVTAANERARSVFARPGKPSLAPWPAGARGERARHERLREGGEVLDEHVAVGEHREQDELGRVGIADDRALDVVQDGPAGAGDVRHRWSSSRTPTMRSSASGGTPGP